MLRATQSCSEKGLVSRGKAVACLQPTPQPQFYLSWSTAHYSSYGYLVYCRRLIGDIWDWALPLAGDKLGRAYAPISAVPSFADVGKL